MAPLNLSLLLLRVDYIVCDIGTVKNRILARHFLNGEKEGGITVKSTHIAKAVKPARYTTFFKTPAKGKRMLAVLLCVCLVAGCAAFSGCGEEPSSYNWEVSIVDTLDPKQGGLSVLPWLITVDEAKEILHLADLPDGAYEEKQESTRLYSITLKNVKLKEYRTPMELCLLFCNNPSITEKQGLLLMEYIFDVSEIDGYSLSSTDADIPSFQTLPEETREKYLQAQQEDRQACLQALLQRSDVIGTEAEQVFTNALNGPILLGIPCDFPGLNDNARAYMLFHDVYLRFYVGTPSAFAAGQ